MTAMAAKAGDRVALRLAQAADLPACAAIVNDVIDETPWLPRTKTRDEIAALFTPDLLSRRVLLVAEAGGEIAGYLSATPEGLIPALFLAPAYRRQGIGARLLDAAKAHFPGGLSLTVFEANAEARRFYEREGLVEDPSGRDEDTEEGIPMLLYRWMGAA